MATLSFESNPVLIRELRANLRNARAFGLLALYVALLGAVVTANFPGDTAIDLQSDGGARGRDLFFWLFGGQVALILAILPAMATGALAQERERQTLQPLILTPLSPLQIVWGKAGGVLSLVGLMLLATLPLRRSVSCWAALIPECSSRRIRRFWDWRFSPRDSVCIVRRAGNRRRAR